ncbi:MAG TPA: DUF5666 domain-containing protein [Terriglobales bacterium]|nr:DUF5666 domain-containing protein [Terriglobales bacterium]
MKKLAVPLLILLSLPAVAQDAPRGAPSGQTPGANGQFERGGMRRRGVGGTITELRSDGLTLKTMSGDTVNVKFSSTTQFAMSGKTIKPSDLKAGDFVMVAGERAEDGTWTANFVVNRTEEMKKWKENLGKTFIAGEVKAINETKLTIQRPDDQTQTIEVDESTSFRRGRDESITLADIKVGDRVTGPGELKNGVFVPSTLRVGGAGGPGSFMGGPPPAGQAQSPKPLPPQ